MLRNTVPHRPRRRGHGIHRARAVEDTSLRGGARRIRLRGGKRARGARHGAMDDWVRRRFPVWRRLAAAPGGVPLLPRLRRRGPHDQPAQRHPLGGAARCQGALAILQSPELTTLLGEILAREMR